MVPAINILLIERSPTFRTSLKRLLVSNGHTVTPTKTYEKGLELLISDGKSEDAFDLMIVGWSSKADSFADQIYVRINEEPLSHFPVILISEDGDPSPIPWLSNRLRTALLAWGDYKDCPKTVDKLIAASEAAFSLRDMSTINVLLVDDSATIRYNYGNILSSMGMNVTTAASVDEAYDLALKNQFDFVVCDYFLPEKNGHVLVKKLKDNESTASIQIAMLTSNYSDQIIKNCLDAGAIECMFKNEAEELFRARILSIARSVFDHRHIGSEHARLDRIISSVGDGVYGVDLEGRIEFINPAACRLLKIENKDELIGQLAQKVIHPKEISAQYASNAATLSQTYVSGNRLEGLKVDARCSGETQGTLVECTAYPMMTEGHHTGTVVAFRDISDREQQESQLLWYSTHDPLSKLFNRVEIERQLEEEIALAQKGDYHSALLFMDLDRFKYINDTAGHLAGDEVLIEVGNRLRSQLSPKDSLARISGDEFAVILRDIEPDPEKLIDDSDRFRVVVELAKFYFNGSGYSCTLTTGASVIGMHTKSVSQAMSEADNACNKAKSLGRNQTQVYEHSDNAAELEKTDLDWSTRIRDAIIWNRFQLVFHPILPLPSIKLEKSNRQILQKSGFWAEGQKRRFEALIRLKDRDSKLITPIEFLPTAERFQMISSIDKWVVDAAFKAINTSKAKDQVELFINLSIQTLLEKPFVDYVSVKLEEHEVNPADIVFEITETGAVSNIDEANTQIKKLNDLGIRFALDDFGSGFASFFHLKHLNVDIVKIDGAFTRNMVENETDRKVIDAINKVAKSMGKKTVLEYVDSAEVISSLKDSDIDYVQGFFLSEPVGSIAQPDKALLDKIVSIRSATRS